jgi:deoxyribodipyrimidine photo-lyase
MRTAVVLFTRDLRVHDQPALAAAVEAAEQVVPLFVLDRELTAHFGAPNRVAFLLDALRDLASSLRERGGALVVRRGDVVAETMRVAAGTGAAAIFVGEDVSGYAQARERRLRAACEEARLDLRVSPGVTIVPPGEVVPAGSDHFRIFTPYWRRWCDAPRRRVLPAPGRISLPAGLKRGRLPSLADLVVGTPSSELPVGGETAGRRRLERWLDDGLAAYGSRHDGLAANGTSRLSPYLHFGCVSPLEVAERAAGRPGGRPFVRQLAWRDFFAQLLAANPQSAVADFRARGDCWHDDADAYAAWREGRTGYPVVDAGMRQLALEGWMHNRARLITASFLTKDLYVDWRLGAAHYFELLVDGDVASNAGSWQWVAGTGVDPRQHRIFNPTVQGKRFDPDGDYVRRYVPELAGIEGGAVHEPWRLGLLRPPEYPEPIADHAEAVAAFRRRRAPTS